MKRSFSFSSCSSSSCVLPTALFFVGGGGFLFLLRVTARSHGWRTEQTAAVAAPDGCVREYLVGRERRLARRRHRLLVGRHRALPHHPPTHPPTGRETHLERERGRPPPSAGCVWGGRNVSERARRGEKLTRRRWRRREKERKGGHHTTTYQRRRRRRRRRRRFCRCSRWSLVSFKRRQGPCSGISSLACSLRWSSFSRWRSPSSWTAPPLRSSPLLLLLLLHSTAAAAAPASQGISTCSSAPPPPPPYRRRRRQRRRRHCFKLPFFTGAVSCSCFLSYYSVRVCVCSWARETKFFFSSPVTLWFGKLLCFFFKYWDNCRWSSLASRSLAVTHHFLSRRVLLFDKLKNRKQSEKRPQFATAPLPFSLSSPSPFVPAGLVVVCHSSSCRFASTASTPHQAIKTSSSQQPLQPSQSRRIDIVMWRTVKETCRENGLGCKLISSPLFSILQQISPFFSSSFSSFSSWLVDSPSVRSDSSSSLHSIQ